MKKTKRNELYFAIAFTIFLILYCAFCVQELKWRLFLLPYGSLLLIRTVYKWLEEEGVAVNCVKVLKVINKVITAIYVVAWGIAIVGSLIGAWNL